MSTNTPLSPSQSSSAGTTISSHKGVSFLLEGDDQVPCGLCLDPFDPLEKPPKILPCGHNFCEQCLFSLCCHQQYYLLDSINCPTCRRSFNSKIAINAPTNYDLCKMLENVKRVKDLNITVIRVADNTSLSTAASSSPDSGSLVKNPRTTNTPANVNEPSRSDGQTHAEKVEKPLNPSVNRPVNPSASARKINSLRKAAPVMGMKMPQSKAQIQHLRRVTHLPTTGSNDEKRKEIEVEVQTGRDLAAKNMDERNRCVDCKRKLGCEQRSKTSRFCQRCHQHDKNLLLSCLECCVNRHNGHQLRSLSDLEFVHQKLLNELKDLHQRRADISQRFDENLKLLEDENHISVDCSSLGRAKQTLMKESEKSYHKAITKLETRDTFPLPPAIIAKIRHRQLHNFTRLQKMSSLLEKCLKNVSNRFERHVALMTKSLPKTISTISQKSTSSTMKTDESTAYGSLCTVLALTGDTFPEYGVIQDHLPTILSQNSTDDQKIDALKTCIEILNKVLDESSSPETILLFEDAYLNCFHTLNSLSKRINHPQERSQIWKMAQNSFSELLRIASKHWSSSCPDRVDLVNDISYLCHLYADVCDTATIALCMIETARSRAIQDQVESQEDRYRMEIQLKLIDEHLMECRRVQKLSELKSSTKVIKSPGRCGKIKKWFKSTARCLVPKNVAVQL